MLSSLSAIPLTLETCRRKQYAGPCCISVVVQSSLQRSYYGYMLRSYNLFNT